MRTFVSKRRLRSASLKDAASKGEQVLRLSLFKKGTVAAALIGSICLIDSIQAQMPGRGPAAPVRPTVVAGIAGESNPVTRKKYVGNVEAIEEVDSVARVSGVLTVAPGFEEGSNVTKGQLLFTIDPVPYQARVEVAKATIQQLEAQIDYAEKNYNRLNELFERNAGSLNEMESAESTLRSLNAQLLAAKAQLVLAEEDLGYTQITSKIDGRAGKRAYSTGNYVSLQSDPLVKVIQTDPIYVRFTMSERDYLSMFENFDDLKNNTRITLTLSNDATYPLEGEVSFTDNTVKSTTDTVKVWATFKNPNETLKPGGVVTVHLAKYGKTKVATIEPSAVMFDGKKNYVYQLVDSLDDEQLYNEIKLDSRFAKSVEIMEAAVEAAIGGNEAVTKFLSEYKDDALVKEEAVGISEALKKGDASLAVFELAANLAKMKKPKPEKTSWFKKESKQEDEFIPEEALSKVKSGGLEAWKEMFLTAFKKETVRYVYEDPETKETVDDFADNKVNDKYLMAIRRNVTLGPAGDNCETILSGVKPNDVIMIDGVHKARSFDLVTPVYRSEQNQSPEVEPQAKNESPAKDATDVKESDESGKQGAKRVDAKKNSASGTILVGDVAI